MNYIASVKRTASVAWSPNAENGDYFLAATAEGSLSESFDSSASLEAFQVDSGTQNLPVVSKFEIPDRVTSLTWGARNGTDGIVATGFSSGNINFMDASKLLNKESQFESETIASVQKHNTPVYCAKFNPLQSQVMASGSDNSEVFIWNLAKPETPVAYAPGSTQTTKGNITDLQWNGIVPYILGTVTQDAKVVIWDLRNKRPAVQFTDRSGKLKNCKSICWNPSNSMQLVTASADDDSPIIQVWNLRKPQMPMATLQGHNKGIWSTSWCPTDSKYLLSVGQSDKAVCWNMETNSVAHEIQLNSEWNDSIQWSNHMEATFNVSSGEEVGVYSVHDVQQPALVGNAATYSSPPSWLRRPAGASFGFGGKLISVEGSSVQVKSITTQPEVIECASAIEEVIRLDDHQTYCEDRAAQSQDNEDKEVWKFLSAQFQDDKRSAILKQIGFDKDEAQQAVFKLEECNQVQEEVLEDIKEISLPDEDMEVKEEKGEDVSDLFGGSSEFDPFAGGNFDDDQFNFSAHQDDPFGSLPVEDEWSQLNGEENTHTMDGQNVSSSNIIELASKMDSTLNFLQGNDYNEQVLIRNILLKNFDVAIDCCFRLNRAADALVIAMNSNDSTLLERTQARYFQSLSKKSALHIASKLSQNKLREIIAQANIEEWRCSLAIICSYSNDDGEFQELCNDLGDLLAHCGQFHAANICFICAGNVDKALSLWDRQTQGKTRLEHLRSVMEKICVLRSIGDSDLVGVEMVKKYCEFAEILASQGQLQQAYQFVSFLNSEEYSAFRDNAVLQRINSSIEDSTPENVTTQVVGEQKQIQTPPSSQPNVAPQKMQPAHTLNPQSVPPIQPSNPVNPVRQPVQTLNPVQPIASTYTPPIRNVAPPVSFGTQNRYTPSNPPPMEPLKQVQSVQQPMRPVQPVQQPMRPIQPVNSVASPFSPPVANVAPTNPSVFNPYKQPQAVPTLPEVATPKTEPLPAAVAAPAPKKEEAVPGRVEIADELHQAVEKFKQEYNGNSNIQKLLAGCDASRIQILRAKLNKNEISNETADVLNEFVKQFQAKDATQLEQTYAWLTKKKYQEVSAKVMLGLKKLVGASKKF